MKVTPLLSFIFICLGRLTNCSKCAKTGIHWRDLHFLGKLCISRNTNWCTREINCARYRQARTVAEYYLELTKTAETFISVWRGQTRPRR